MSNPGFTERPWEFLEEGRTEEKYNRGRALTIGGGPERDDIAIVFSRDDTNVSTSRQEAIVNARLIAAAPDLYEALVEARSDIKKITEGAVELLRLHGHLCDPAERTYGPAVAKIDAALAAVKEGAD